MKNRKVYLEKNRDVNSVNEESFVNIDLSTKYKLLPYNDISDFLNLNNLYTAERNACRKYRLILTINPICTNVLFNNRTEVVRYEGSSATTLILGDYEPEQTTTFSVVPTEISFDTSRSSTTITIETEGQDWVINGIDNSDWLSVDKLYGDEGKTTVTVTVNSNVGGGSRNKQFTVVGSDGDSATVTVSQSGLGFGIIVEPDEVLFNTSGGSTNIQITAKNQSWTITDLCDWVIANKITGRPGVSTVNLSTSTNIEASARTCQFNVVGDETGDKVNVTIVQNGTDYILDVEPLSLSFDNTGGTKELAITTENQSWIIVEKPNWVTISQNTGCTGTTNITVEVDENMAGIRNGHIVINGSFIGSKTVEVAQTSVALTGITAEIMQPTPLIPASGGVVDCQTEGIQYQVIGHYDNGRTNPIEEGYSIVNCYSVSADTRSAITGDERYIGDLIVEIGYEEHSASAKTQISQQENTVTVTTTDPEKVNEHEIEWSESSITYDINVEPSTKTVAYTDGHYDIQVNASAITCYSGFTCDIWQTAVTITSAYTSGVKEITTITGDTIFSGDTAYTGTSINIETTDTKLETTGTTDWAIASPVENGISRISFEENDGEEPREKTFQYSVIEKPDIIESHSIIQNPGSRNVTFDFSNSMNNYFVNDYYRDSLRNITCSCTTMDDKLIWSADYGYGNSLRFLDSTRYPTDANWTTYEIDDRAKFKANVKYGVQEIQFKLIFRFVSVIKEGWAEVESTFFCTGMTDNKNEYSVILPYVSWDDDQ